MVIKLGKYGKFYACSNFPDCRNTKPIVKEIGVTCPVCHEGQVIERKSKKNRIFYGCSRFPECEFTSWDKPVGRNCPKCDQYLGREKGQRRQTSGLCEWRLRRRHPKIRNEKRFFIENVNVVGAGLAGSEAAWQIAQAGVPVRLYEMRPVKSTEAHHTSNFAELVCSNSLRGNSLANAVGLLKEEMRRLNSVVILQQMKQLFLLEEL